VRGESSDSPACTFTSASWVNSDQHPSTVTEFSANQAPLEALIAIYENGWAKRIGQSPVITVEGLRSWFD
jgi:hypothetical protein